MRNNGIWPVLITKIQLFIDGDLVGVQSSEAVRDVIPTVFHEYTYNLDYMII